MELEEEAIELRFGQRVRALALQRVLRRQDEERLFQRVARLGDGDSMLLHRLEERALRLRRGAVHLVGEHDVRENGAFAEAELLLAAARLLDHGRPEDVGGHHVRRELDARELKLERLGHGAHEHRLTETRHAFEERVRPRQHARDDAVDHVAIADDDLPHLFAELADAALKVEHVGPRGVFRLLGHGNLPKKSGA